MKDIRAKPLFLEAEALYGALRRPGTGTISDATEISAHGSHAVFAGTLAEELQGTLPTRICLTDLDAGDVRVLTFGPNTDRLPKYSPDGLRVAFLSDRRKAGEFQLYLLDPISGVAMSTPAVDGWVEYLHWSPDGRRILLGVAGHGADVSSIQGAITSNKSPESGPAWLPTVDVGEESYQWRRICVYDLREGTVRQVSHAGSNFWEAEWCGNDAIAAVVSPGPVEGLWYSARLQLIGLHTGDCRTIYQPTDQLGWPAASPSGGILAIVEACCSDRGFVAGALKLIDTASSQVRDVDTRGVDVTYTEWCSDRYMLLAGHRGFETVVARYDATLDSVTELWSSSDVSTGGSYVTVSGLNEVGDCVLVGESFIRAPEIAVIRGGGYRVLRSFDLGYSEHTKAIDTIDRVRWVASDGLEIQGWLLRPAGAYPRPLVMIVHGGPVWHSRPVWLGRRSAHVLMLIKRGYAIFFPNPRGSAGRGREFVHHVYGDLGGADAQDLLAGLDALVARGMADPARLGVMGVSYGGFMTSWLITQDSRFAAAIPVAPHTNHVTEHLLSNIPQFMALFLEDTYNNPGGKYFQRSPVMHAEKVRTPTLNICGARDRCTPPEEAAQFHNALLERGTISVLITYPEEGHGVRTWPAIIDYAARIVGWFQEHMPPDD